MTVTEIGELESIEAIYLFLSRIFLREIDAEFLQQLRSDKMATTLEFIGVDLPMLAEDDDELLESLSVEYASLFIAPGSLPPYQSVEEDGRYIGDVADRQEAFYQDCGFNYRKEFPDIFPDHIGIQFSLASALLEGEIKAMRAGNFQEAYEHYSRRKEFFEKFLGKWYSGYFNKLSDGVTDPFYKAVTDFTKAFLDSEAENLHHRSESYENGVEKR